MDAFVHASGDGFGNTAPLRSDTGAIDMDAISQVAHVTQGAGKLTRKEKKHAKREMKRRKKEAKKAEKEAKKTYSSIKSQLKDRDKELSDKMADARKKRDSAKDVVNYIGYNKMYQDGICEVEEGMFSSSIAFDDTSYHSVRDEQQKAMFSAITRLYDQFGADTLVQMSVINTPLLKEEVGHRKFFDPERQANDAARNDAQVFNNILNDKVKEGVSNIRRNRYLTYSVTADTAEDAARQLSRIEVESSRILNSIGSKAHLMNGTQRLSVIHSLLNPYKPFLFDYQRDISAKRLQTTKDCIAPTQIDFRPDGHYNDCVKLDNGVYAQVLVMKKFGSELSDRALADMADLPIPMAITWYVQPMDKSKATFENRAGTVRKHFSCFYEKFTDAIEPIDIQNWQLALIRAGYSPNYVRVTQGMLSVAFDRAVILGITERNPSRMVGNVRGQKPLVDFWTLDEFEKVISKLYKGDYYEHYLFISLLFLFMSGMRLGEASALLWSDIDFTTGLCSITKTLYYHNQSDYKFTKPKTRAAIRSIYLDEDTLSELAAWRKVQRVVIPDCEFVLSYNGLPTTKTRLPRAMKKLADLAGVHRVRVHDLRHSHASLLINMGESPLLLKERLGHEKIQTTLGTYGHLYPNTNQAVAKKLTGILNYSEPKTSIANYTSNQHTADYHRA